MGFASLRHDDCLCPSRIVYSRQRRDRRIYVSGLALGDPRNHAAGAWIEGLPERRPPTVRQ